MNEYSYTQPYDLWLSVDTSICIQMTLQNLQYTEMITKTKSTRKKFSATVRTSRLHVEPQSNVWTLFLGLVYFKRLTYTLWGRVSLNFGWWIYLEFWKYIQEMLSNVSTPSPRSWTSETGWYIWNFENIFQRCPQMLDAKFQKLN